MYAILTDALWFSTDNLAAITGHTPMSLHVRSTNGPIAGRACNAVSDHRTVRVQSGFSDLMRANRNICSYIVGITMIAGTNMFAIMHLKLHVLFENMTRNQTCRYNTQLSDQAITV